MMVNFMLLYLLFLKFLLRYDFYVCTFKKNLNNSHKFKLPVTYFYEIWKKICNGY